MKLGSLSKLGGASNIQIQKTGAEGIFLSFALLPASDLECWANRLITHGPHSAGNSEE